MKTKIIITGQISGNRNLLNKIGASNVKNLRFNNYSVSFDTKKEAIKALSEARQAIKNEDPEFYLNGCSYIRGSQLSYDASTARLFNELV